MVHVSVPVNALALSLHSTPACILSLAALTGGATLTGSLTLSSVPSHRRMATLTLTGSVQRPAPRRSPSRRDHALTHACHTRVAASGGTGLERSFRAVGKRTPSISTLMATPFSAVRVNAGS